MTYEVTGTELIAPLLESAEIRRLRPPANRLRIPGTGQLVRTALNDYPYPRPDFLVRGAGRRAEAASRH